MHILSFTCTMQFMPPTYTSGTCLLFLSFAGNNWIFICANLELYWTCKYLSPKRDNSGSNRYQFYTEYFWKKTSNFSKGTSRITAMKAVDRRHVRYYFNSKLMQNFNACTCLTFISHVLNKYHNCWKALLNYFS